MSNKRSCSTALILHPTTQHQNPTTDRRNNDRVHITHFLKAGCAVSHDRMQNIELINVSAGGCAFRVPFTSENAWPSQFEEMVLRLYFSNETFIQLTVRILHKHPMTENGHKYLLFGCAMNQECAAYPVYEAFVLFLRSYAEHAVCEADSVFVPRNL